MKSVDERKTTARVSVADNMLLPTTLPKVQGRLGSDDVRHAKTHHQFGFMGLER
jgi:hypothetical protein